MTENRKLSVFLCHASNDKKVVRELYKRLSNDGYDPWLDEEKLLPGQEWDLEIRNAVEKADVILVCLSKGSVTKSGYVHKEIRLALDLSEEQPEEAIFLVPARLDECEVPRRLSQWQWVDIFNEEGYYKLLASLEHRAHHVGVQGRRPPRFGVYTLEVPAGEFIMGPASQIVNQVSMDNTLTKILEVKRVVTSQPQHVVRLGTYYIGKYLVTNREYCEFVKAIDYDPPSDWIGDRFPNGKANHPVVNVSWEDATAYCNWLCMKTKEYYRLPTEAEWEKASRGVDGRLYPWGNLFKEKLANTAESGNGDTSPVGEFSPQGDSPYGCVDIVGNVREWCADFFDDDEYQNRVDSKVNNPKGPTKYFREEKVLRGGSFTDNSQIACCTYRHHASPHFIDKNIGFRVARDFTLVDFF